MPPPDDLEVKWFMIKGGMVVGFMAAVLNTSFEYVAVPEVLPPVLVGRLLGGFMCGALFSIPPLLLILMANSELRRYDWLCLITGLLGIMASMYVTVSSFLGPEGSFSTLGLFLFPYVTGPTVIMSALSFWRLGSERSRQPDPPLPTGQAVANSVAKRKPSIVLVCTGGGQRPEQELQAILVEGVAAPEPTVS